MLEPGFTIELDPDRGMLTLTLSGFFGEADVARLAVEKAAAHRALGCAPNMHLALADLTALKIQPQTVVDAFSHLIRAPRYRARRLAFVTGGSLVRMQVRRIARDAPNVACFDTRDAAIAWLLAADGARSAA